ncbi:PEP-utilizing enzyme [Niveibacterium sp. 24ML]|uniref:PEP-utilizing enzyme n=1 Tax=Niveibacterium sp. 24ML TaxID=2985512 RepID=UPI00226ED336|nr:PEP-utilizing enzyme [Niveibacterium sp. 24ML]MCX9156177.1 PEP-utilizing enzyme [Niveibacterium sp. 24ML]
MASFTFATKAGTLQALQGRLTLAAIPPLLRLGVADWQQQRAASLMQVQQQFAGQQLIIRSSCTLEDCHQQSQAGAFLSRLDIAADDCAAVATAIDAVIASYGRIAAEDEVLIQPMLQRVARSGVAFSHDPNTCAPYRVISWRDGSDTTAVTGGSSGSSGSETWQGAAWLPAEVTPPAPIAPVLALMEELQALTGDQPFDLEFAVTEADSQPQLWLLQLRPLILREPPQSSERQQQLLSLIASKVAKGFKPHPLLIGQRTIYGVMPDWNPAEIIGIRPKPLALSLYRELVTDAIWAYQRHNYGYRNLRSFPLMQHFCGLPYIDVRLSFNSFIPADLPDSLAGRLVDYYIDKLLAQPALHDKVEFEIVFSCYTLDLPERLQPLLAHGFSADELTQIADSLRRLTNGIIDGQSGLWRQDAAKLDTLRERREAVLNADLDAPAKIYWLLEDAKRYGTLPFAGLARAGFVAVQLLRSLVDVGVLSSADYDQFLASISTVSKQMSRDRSSSDRSLFLARYGHLRPGTYDLLSPRYDEAPDQYFDWQQQPPAPEAVAPFALTLAQMKRISALLQEHGLNHDVVGLFEFLQAGIELREYAKFCFTRNVSDALSLLSAYGQQLGFSAEEIACCDIQCIQQLEVCAVDAHSLLRHSIERGQQSYSDTRHLALPPVIRNLADVWAFSWPETVPNFITQKQVMASVVSHEERAALAGAIVCIPNADPGYDWLFGYPIAGLITAWGGVNSHMAIRAGELGLPAVIGAGESHFRRWSSARRLAIDCALRRVEVIE